MKELTAKDKRKLKKMKKLTIWGIKHNLVFKYVDELFDALRPYNYGGFPASITLFVNELCNGKCYDRARLMSLAFDDAVVVHATIETLRITDGEEYAEHAFVETKEFGENKTWVVDTSSGLVFEKDFYYLLEKPKINHIFTKEELMQSPFIHEHIVDNFENDKYILPTILPFIEKCIENSNALATCIYKEKLKKEIELFKEKINYDEIAAEIKNDMDLLKKDRRALDEKLKIVRDEYGREISRNGVPNPYYYSLEDLKKEEDYYNSIQDDPIKLKEYHENLVKKINLETEEEYKILAEKAKARMKEISKNPTKNYYDR